MQAKLTARPSGDVDEREADLAHEVMRMPEPTATGDSSGDRPGTAVETLTLPAIQRQPQAGKKKPVGEYIQYQLLVPAEYTTLDQMYRFFERKIFGGEKNLSWTCGSRCDMSKNAGKVVPFLVSRASVEKYTNPALKKELEQSKKRYEQASRKSRQGINQEVDRRYRELSGDKPKTKIKGGEEGKARMWEQTLNEVMKEKEKLESLPPEVKQLLGPEASYKPEDYQRLLSIVEKLLQFTAEDLAAFKLLTVRATTDLDLFERSVDMFLARKEELKKALAEQQQAGAGKDLSRSSLETMSEDDRYNLAVQRTMELTADQLRYMKEHPGETLKEFAKSATLVNTPETFSAIGKDLREAASGDANSWARWAAGVGAGAKISGWLMAVAGVLYVVSWLTGVGELITIAAAAGVLLGSMITLSTVESELRIRAASQARSPEEFQRNVELAAAAQTNALLGSALFVLALVLHFTAKALFPKTLERISASIKNFRERIRLKGSIYELKPQIVKEMGSRKAELTEAVELAKQKALASAEELGKLSTEQFVDRLEAGDGGLLDQAKLPTEQKVNYRELLKTPEGRAAIEVYRAKLVNALKNDVVQSIERFAEEYRSRIDELLKDVDAAKNHDDLNGALDKIENSLTEEHPKKLLAEEQERITQGKLEEGAAELEAQAAKAKAEAEAKVKAEAQAKAEEASAQQWLDDMRKSLSEAGKKKLAAILRQKQTAKATRDLVESRGGKDFLEGKIEASPIISDPQNLAAFEALEADPAFLNRPAVKRAATIADETQAVQAVRSELAVESASRRLRADYQTNPNARFYEGVKILREQPGFKTVDEYKAANPEYRGPVYERGGKVYKPETEIDLLVTEEAGGKAETILHMEEVKSGELDTPGRAKAQLADAQNALNELANGDPRIRIELQDMTDMTSRFDARSASAAKTATSGPKSDKVWSHSLGVTAADLLAIARRILGKVKAKK